MDLTSRPTRRRLIASALSASSLALRPAARPEAARRLQDLAEPWQAVDGLRLAGSASGDVSLDPALAADLFSNFLVRQLFRGLVSLDRALEPSLELAESVDISDDGLAYTFIVREPARFHDGRSITAEDVRRSLSRALDPATTGGNRDALAGVAYLREIRGAPEMLAGEDQVLSGIEIDGDLTLTITLERRSPTFLMKLASAPASIVDFRQVQGETDWAVSPNGSGPFAVRSWRPGESLEFAASEHWWRGVPRVPRISVRLGASALQPLNLFQAGEIDLLEGVPPELIDLVTDPASGVRYGELLEIPLFATSYITFGNSVAPLDDVHVRRALQHAFPSTLVADGSFNGAMTPATGLLPPGLLGDSWAAQPQPVSARAAREELRRSRYGSAREVPPIAIHAADIAPVESLREVVAEVLGITIEAIQTHWPDFLQGLAEGRFPAYSLYWGADYPDPESMVDMLFASESPQNFTGYRNPELDALLAEARSATGMRRIALYRRANQLLVDDAALIPLYHPVGHTLIRDGIGGVEATAMGILGLETLHERT